jgi:hypothetical protein
MAFFKEENKEECKISKGSGASETMDILEKVEAAIELASESSKFFKQLELDVPVGWHSDSSRTFKSI